MSWKRTKFSYIPWVMLIAISCVVGYYATFDFCVRLGIQGTLVWLIYAGFLFSGGFLCVLFARSKNVSLDNEKKHVILFGVLECVAFLIIFISGCYLRLNNMAYARTGAFFSLAIMKYGESVPDIFVGSEDIYLRALHGICFLFGNTPFFCILFQLVINVVGGILWYFGVRRIAGKIPAIAFAAFYFLHPFVTMGAVVLSAESLIFMIYGIAINLVSVYLKKHSLFISILTGIAIGIAGYFDVFCFTLLILAASVFCLDEKKERIRSFCFLFFSMILAFASSIGLKAFASEKTFGKIISVWLKCYFSNKSYNLQLNDYFWYGFEGFWGSWADIACVILMVVVAFAFLIRGGREKFSPWICIIGISIFAVGLKLPVVDTPFDGSILILSCLFVLAGIGLESFFVKEEAPSAENLEVKEDLVKKLDNKQKLETKQVIEKKDAYTEQNHENENKIRSFKEKRRQKLIDYMEHPESLDDKNFIVKLWFEREKKKYESQMAIERVMNTLVSLSEDHIVWTDGVRTKQNMLTPDAKTVNVPQSVPSSQIDEKTKKENDTIILPQNKGNLEDPDLDYDFEVPEDDDYDYD